MAIFDRIIQMAGMHPPGHRRVGATTTLNLGGIRNFATTSPSLVAVKSPGYSASPRTPGSGGRDSGGIPPLSL